MSHKRKNKGTRPFMPLHGNKKASQPNGGNANGDAGEDVMQVGVEAMLEDASEQPPAPEEAGNAEEQPRPEAELPVEEPEPVDAEEAAPRSELEKLRAERDSYLDLARRERADFDNYRKRIQREMAEMKRQSLAGFLKEFFGPLDDMDRVLQESVKDQSFESLVGGVRIMEENFWRVLAKVGVRKIDAKGKPFDPAMHEAMTAVPSSDVAPNTVIEVFENGYKLDDFVLRPARVIVSRAPDA